MKQRHLYRIETIDLGTGESICGFVSPIMCFFRDNYGVNDGHDMSIIINKLSPKSLERTMILTCFYILDGLTIPETYINDTDDYVCLYTKTSFKEKEQEICAMAEAYKRLVPNEEMRFKEFIIPGDEIVFKERNQVVITWDTYNKYKNENKHKKFVPVFFDFDFDQFIPKQSAQSPTG